MFVSAACFGGRFLISAAAVLVHNICLLYFGYGVGGGIGLGLGYISSVSTHTEWFPDPPGMTTGLAIMGFGGGATIGSPLSNALLAVHRQAIDDGRPRSAPSASQSQPILRPPLHRDLYTDLVVG